MSSPAQPTGQHVEVPAGHGAAPAHSGSGPVDGAMFFWMLVIFGIAAAILKKHAFGPILENLDAREKEIEKSLENADHLERELATLDFTVQEKLENAENQVRGMIDSGREAAREAAKVIEAQAREQAQIVRENAERDIATARGKAEASLRVTSAETAVALTLKLLNQNLDAKGKQALTDQLIAGM